MQLALSLAAQTGIEHSGCLSEPALDSMTTFLRTALKLAMLLCLANSVHGEDLAPFGALPKLEKEWVAHKSGQRGIMSWTVFQNTKTGALLSFASRKLTPTDKRELIYFSDSSREFFCARGEVPPPGSNETFNISPIQTKVTKLHLMNAGRDLSRDALGFTWVGETEDRSESWMAHGYVMIFDDVCLYIQHTSKRPIAMEFVEGVAVDAIDLQATQNKGK